MQRSGMWGYKDTTDKGVLKERYKYILFCHPCRIPLTASFL
ncbi:hypothetical protein Barb4_03032 [Bacteroidales bacterium Barb4]|nr:hypothetical protein Barb4_03032 [Bacteroidales bacterium Barb4]